MKIKVSVPATSANIGSGFDALGLAVTLYNTVTFEESEVLDISSADGTRIPRGESNLVYRSAKGLFEKVGKQIPPLKITQTNPIPMARGLGSSSACIIAGLLGANRMLGDVLNTQELLTLATSIEGHPDNVAPALLGGLTSSVFEEGKVYSVKRNVDETLCFAAELYEYDYSDYYTTGAANVTFGGEKQISSAIYKLTAAAESHAYYTTNHGEQALTSSLTEALKAQNIDAQPLDLLTGTIPEDCDLLIVSDPASDFAADGLVDEIAQLQAYLENGGKVLLTTSGYTETPDLDAVMAQFGLAREPGLVVEGDAGHALYGYPYSLFPDYAAADESTALDGVNQSTHVMLSVAQGITITETDDVTAEPLLYTTEDAYSKQDFDASSSSAKEAGDTDGPFSLAVWARNDSTGAEVIWIGCPNMDNEQVYQSIPGNLTFLQGCAASLVGQSLLIDTKALEAAPITVPASASMTLGMVFVFVLPAAVLIAGAVEVLLRRRR